MNRGLSDKQSFRVLTCLVKNSLNWTIPHQALNGKWYLAHIAEE